MTTVVGHAYHVFPPPPPTVNALSSRQKAQLRRTTTKLTRVLGATPQIVDNYSGPIKVPLSTSQTVQRSQPSLSVYSGKKLHKRSKSANDQIDPDFFPLSSSPRPEGRRRPSSASPTSTVTSRPVPDISAQPPFFDTRQTRSRSVSSSFAPSFSATSSAPHLSLPPLPRPPQARPPRNDDAQSTFSRDSLCDSLYEPTFAIPSPIAARREKMARVCKLLGEGVPVDLVFPPEEPDVDELAKEYDFVMDICAHSPEPQSEVPPPVPPKTEFPPLKIPNQPRSLTYRASTNSSASSAPMLETIEERSPRSSCSSSCSTESDSTILSTTTSSSYRYKPAVRTSSSPSPSDDPFTSVYYAHPIRDIAEKSRREFAIYVPFNRRRSSSGSKAEIERRGNQEFEVVRGTTDLRF